MSKIKKDYEQTFFGKMEQWINGENDAFYEEPEAQALEEREKKAGLNYFAYLEQIPDAGYSYERVRAFHYVYRILTVLMGVFIVGTLLYVVYFLPPFGNADNPVNNEVSQRYIEKGMEETGAVNIVAGMILDYRAFDTFGESNVLFIAASAVLLLLRVGDGTKTSKSQKEIGMKDDIILQRVTFVLSPMLLLFGIYVILNGHLSPGGGFSGGAIIGGSLILFRNSYGYEAIERFFTERTFQNCTLIALGFYCLAKSYSFFTGANHLNSHIPLGTPGDILSAGLILPLNLAVGIVVACTMYSFYALFSKGGI
jgi:multisubunit Na+/H+ antiporter MnhB subunit